MDASGGHFNRNPSGKNQYGGRAVPDGLEQQFAAIIIDMLQHGLDRRKIQRDLGQIHGIHLSRRTLYRWMDKLSIPTPRRPFHTDLEVGQAIVDLVEEDLTNQWGRARIHHKLRLHKGMQDANSGFVRHFLRALDPGHALARAPGHKHRIHQTSLWTIGPSEEWSGDGHDKLARMGLPIWGLRDKATRRWLGLWVVPNSRKLEVPAALFLRAVRQAGGVPLKVSLDRGSEGGLLGRLQTEIRATYAPDLDSEALPPFGQIPSIYNITIERSWRYLYENELKAVLEAWNVGVLSGIYHEAIPIEHAISRWLWARLVQSKLDAFVIERNSARIRRQPKVHLPTGDSPDEFWFHPQNFNLQDNLVHVPADHIDELIAEYDPVDLFRFVPEEMERLCHTLYKQVGSPILTVLNLWQVYLNMLELVP